MSEKEIHHAHQTKNKSKEQKDALKADLVPRLKAGEYVVCPDCKKVQLFVATEDQRENYESAHVWIDGHVYVVATCRSCNSKAVKKDRSFFANLDDLVRIYCYPEPIRKLVKQKKRKCF
jgi:hypothetical protein